jgi:hypothetical protein
MVTSTMTVTIPARFHRAFRLHSCCHSLTTPEPILTIPFDGRTSDRATIARTPPSQIAQQQFIKEMTLDCFQIPTLSKANDLGIPQLRQRDPLGASTAIFAGMDLVFHTYGRGWPTWQKILSLRESPGVFAGQGTCERPTTDGPRPPTLPETAPELPGNR